MRRVYAGILFCLLAAAASTALADGTVAERRAAVLAAAQEGEAGIPILSQALNDENILVRHAAIRALAEIGAPAREALEKAFGNSDDLVRRAALNALAGLSGEKPLPLMDRALKDPNEEVRQSAVGLLVAMKPRTQEVLLLLRVAKEDSAASVRGPAAQALFPFYKNTVLLQDRPDWDHAVTVVQQIALPKNDWRFKPDPQEDGQDLKWFNAAFDDSAWALIPIEQSWQAAGQNCNGIAWYRKSFDLPAKPECNAVEFRFDGVDESAWVWVNGEYVGQHDMGPVGWDKPFSLDVTKEVKWGANNQITVRVQKTTPVAHSGIWQPVTLEVMK